MAFSWSVHSVTDGQVRTATRWAGGLWLATTVVMLRLERVMRATGGPGIIAFELAGTPDRASSMIDSWGPKGVAAARTSLWLDFGYMTTYGAFAVLLAEGADRRLARRRSGSRLFPWAQLACGAAVAADAAEGVALLNILGGRDRRTHAVRARRAALIKFALLSAVLAHWARSHVPERHSES
ncbi:hypothetical protein [Mycobacterium kyogaense]|uniref:hypothetical protein n=1 Tax=Mycobacterium kyogaense TaxID=2212479 RepID=UPI000DAD2582|nr:hypothetical protein [Mycobacterium kyogaense]